MENIIKGFTLENEDKLNRALNEVQGSDGSYDEDALLAEYDKIGGLITKDGKENKVKTGSFYDFKNKKALKEPKIVFVYNVNGEFVDVPADEEMPGEVKAAKILAGSKLNKGKKVKAAKVEVTEDGEESEAVEEKPKAKKGKK